MVHTRVHQKMLGVHYYERVHHKLVDYERVHRLAPQLSPVDKLEAAIDRSSNIKFNSNIKIY